MSQLINGTTVGAHFCFLFPLSHCLNKINDFLVDRFIDLTASMLCVLCYFCCCKSQSNRFRFFLWFGLLSLLSYGCGTLPSLFRLRYLPAMWLVQEVRTVVLFPFLSGLALGFSTLCGMWRESIPG